MIAITPQNDTEEHEMYSTICKCMPKVIFENGEMIIVHNAFDGRQFNEQINLILNEDGGKYMDSYLYEILNQIGQFLSYLGKTDHAIMLFEIAKELQENNIRTIQQYKNIFDNPN